jgi:uncharacterized protein YcbX
VSRDLVAMTQVSSAFVYPVKSLRGLEVGSISIANGCVVGDRMWVLVDEDGQFMHQRDYPHMAALDLSAVAGGIQISAPGHEPLTLENEQEISPDVEYVRLWRRAAAVNACGAAADHWFSSALRMTCRLYRFTEKSPGFDVPDSERDSSLQDATPFHVVSSDSLADLSKRVGYSMPAIRFRPNFTVSGAEPYEEDTWRSIRVGPHIFHWVKPCTRCAITTTDHITGLRPDREPLRSLARYRRWGNQVAFGHYLTTESRSGSITVGDQVEVVGTA